MIERQQNVYSWQFTFLGANQDAFAEASSMGIRAEGAANYSDHQVRAAHRATGMKIARMRQQARDGQAIKNEFTDEEREQMQ
jgi:hypothetical protein